MDEQDIPYEEMFQRCGTELTDEKVQDLTEKFKRNACRRSTVLGTPKIGTTVDGYKVVGYLGTGGFGTVCLVQKNGLYFAMKFLLVKKERRGPDKEFKLLYANLLSPEHQYLLTALEWNELKSKELKKLFNSYREGKEKPCYMIMKLTGPSLNIISENIRKQDEFPVLQGVPIMRNALRSLQVFHERRLVHHDVKLDNFAVDINDKEKILLLDYGMATCAPRNVTAMVGFKGTRNYASRRALKGELQSYRDDYESWFNSLLYFMHGGLPWTNNNQLLEEMEEFWSAPNSTNNPHIAKILKHINHLNFYEKINYDFVDSCLQDIIAEENGISYIPYIYRQSYKGHPYKVITKGKHTFTTDKPDTKERIAFYCSAPACLFRIFVEINGFINAKDGDEAIIIDTKNYHTCLEM